MSEFDHVKDSGRRSKFTTGSQRDIQKGKGRFDLLPSYAIYRLAVHYENGADKYGDHNWRLGQPYHVYINSALRHLFKALAGQNDEDHLAAAVWNIVCLLETQQAVKEGRLPEELDDLEFDLKPQDWG